MIVNIKAMFACDRCGARFIVPIDPAHTPAAPWCPMDFAENAIRAGHGHEDGLGQLTNEMAAMFGNKHYCQSCTEKRDAKVLKKHS